MLGIVSRIEQQALSAGDLPSGYENSFVNFFKRSFKYGETFPGDPYLCYREHMYESAPLAEVRQTAIVLPCLILETLAEHETKQKAYHGLKDHLRKPCEGRKLYSTAIYLERTLDEAYYPALWKEALEDRNQKQVVSREFRYHVERERREGEDNDQLSAHELDREREGRRHFAVQWKRDVEAAGVAIGKRLFRSRSRNPDHSYRVGVPTACGQADDLVRDQSSSDKNDLTPILVVPQLWIWRLGNTIVSAQALTRSTSTLGTDPEKGWQLHLVTRASPELQIAAIVSDQIDLFGQPQAHGLAPLDFFELGICRLLSDAERYVARRAYKDLKIDKEASLLNDTADIKTELAMMKHVLTQQKEVLDPVLRALAQSPVERNDGAIDDQISTLGASSSNVPKEPTLASHEHMLTARQKALSSMDTLQKYFDRIEKILRDAEHVEKMIQDQLELKRSYVSIRDARAGLVVAVSVIGFTAVTMIFTPLSFITGLFQLPLESLARTMVPVAGAGSTNSVNDTVNSSGNDAGNDSGDDDSAYTSAEVARWFVTTEFATLAVTLALSVGVYFLFIQLHDQQDSSTKESFDNKNKPSQVRSRWLSKLRSWRAPGKQESTSVNGSPGAEFKEGKEAV
ncbi:hypothetical protein HII31_06423 [Pseudocercospora fuligena]|uniref:Ankyrin repeat protein n=1 Tax=Pseudocercospora fuligena TaxID=685502 RepID=A0A8H6RH44_9PEZI|nr:hypothetical protein HII31_06423 [Pseudocercospora fuligena]